VLFGRDHTHQLGIKARRQLGELNAFVVESLQGMRDVFALDAAMERRKGFSALARSYAPIRLSFNRARALQTVFVDAVVGSAALAVALTAIHLVREGRLEATALPLVVTAAIGSFLSVSMLAGAGRQMTETLAAAQRLSLVRDEPVPVVDGPHPVPPTRPKEVRFEDVQFTYPGTDEPALGGVTFRLAPGRTTALVGPSGAGKSTIAHLLMRFWDPTSGTITLDGTPLSAFELDSLRETVSLVSQDTYLFNTTIKENLLIARPDATSAQLASAVSRSGLEELIGELPDGLGTKVGERGLQLSGGQRQRIAIARAFLKEAPILVLDEATSHLDAVNESLIRSALLELASDRTTLVIAHRLSTVRSADQILVLERGRIVQSGTHEQLARSAGLYAVLVSAQVRAGRAVAG
jgi:ABC-type multidrug transport system fused ATPase/permease subunit